jgi:hypothetical protein
MENDKNDKNDKNECSERYSESQPYPRGGEMKGTIREKNLFDAAVNRRTIFLTRRRT